MRKTYKIIMLNLAVYVLFGALNAQISTRYSFVPTHTAWQEIWGDYATEAMTDEGISSPIDIGFIFPYGSYTYTQVKISSNGWLNLGTNLNNPYYANDNTIATLNVRPVIAPLWDDLDMTTGAIQTGTFGVEPHRIFVAQWLAAKWNASGDNEYNFMVRLHETGQVDMIYGPHTGSPHSASATMGINMAPGGPGNYFSIMPGLPSHASSSTSYDDLQVSNTEGTSFLFFPRTAYSQDACAVNISGPVNPMQHVLVEYSPTIGNAGTATILRDSTTVYLMRGEEILASTTVSNNIMPGYSSAPLLEWAPDTTGVMNLIAKVVLPNDPDSLNNVSYPFTIDVQAFVGNDDPTLPAVASLISCYPNPFATEATISYSLKAAAPVKIDIFNLKGQKLKSILAENKAQGSYTTKWNGTDDNGRHVSNGIYLCRLSSTKDSHIKKLILIR